MTIFGKQVSISVLATYVVGLLLIALGLAQNIITGWSTSNFQADALLVAGALTTLLNTAVHNWTSVNTTPAAPVPPPAPPALTS